MGQFTVTNIRKNDIRSKSILLIKLMMWSCANDSSKRERSKYSLTNTFYANILEVTIKNMHLNWNLESKKKGSNLS